MLYEWVAAKRGDNIPLNAVYAGQCGADDGDVYVARFDNTPGKVNLENENQNLLIKDLTKQFDQLFVKSILRDKSKNIINDEKINGVNVRMQKIDGLPPKELRRLIDNGKKEIGEGIVIIFASKDDKVGLAVGITDKLKSKYDAVKFVKNGSEIIGGKGGGGRPDFAQAGGVNKDKIEDAFNSLKALV